MYVLYPHRSQFVLAIQEAFGTNIRVHVDRDSIKAAPEVNQDKLTFEEGGIKLGQVLFTDLRRNHLDFAFDAQGITIIPRRNAWVKPTAAVYSAVDYNMSFDEMRQTIYEGATVSDDWSDVGGAGQMIVDETSGEIGVLHAQSDQFRISNRLSTLLNKQEQ